MYKKLLKFLFILIREVVACCNKWYAIKQNSLVLKRTRLQSESVAIATVVLEHLIYQAVIPCKNVKYSLLTCKLLLFEY